MASEAPPQPPNNPLDPLASANKRPNLQTSKHQDQQQPTKMLVVDENENTATERPLLVDAASAGGAPGSGDSAKTTEKMFTLKKWNAVAMWSWDVECDTCAICRVQVMDACLRCQAESKKDSYGKQDCVVVWGECNHSFHYCCMSLWVKQNNRCPLCQQEWSIQRMGK